MKFVNLTPHDVHMLSPYGAWMTIPRGSEPARVTEGYHGDLQLHADGVGPIYVVEDLEPVRVTGLPDPRPKTGYIVSRPVAWAAPDRRDLYVPYDEVRDDAGRIIGCRGLAALAPPRERKRAEAAEALLFRGYDLYHTTETAVRSEDTWHQWDRAVEKHLRALLGTDGSQHA